MSSSIPWSVSFRAICQQGLVQGRARGVLVPQKTETSLRTQTHALIKSVASVPLGNWIAAVPPFGSVLRTAFERTHNPIARAVRIFQRLRWISNFPGSLSRWSFRTLLQSFQESSCVDVVLLRPDLSLLAAHEKHHATKEIGNGQTCIGEFRNVVR